jgi:hypothetical protein
LIIVISENLFYLHSKKLLADLLADISRIFIIAFCVSIFGFAAFSQSSPIISGDQEQVIIEGASEHETFSFGKTIIVKGSAKEVLVLGGDIIVEGSVTGDVATIGGTIYQKRGGSIGGDVIVLGGSYKSDDKDPIREPGKKTIVYAGYEQELRNIMQNPTQIFASDYSPTFFALRILAVLFWFIISLGLTTISPGGISRFVAKIQLSTLKIVGIGFLGIVLCTIGVIFALGFLPSVLSTIIGLMVLFLLILAYVLGRTTLQVVFGKWLQKKLVPEKWQSESLSLLIGAFVWTVLLSIPFLWTLALVGLMSVSIGLVVTSRSPKVRLSNK